MTAKITASAITSALGLVIKLDAEKENKIDS